MEMLGGSPILQKIGATRRKALRLRILRRVPPGTISKVRQSRVGARKPGRTICSRKAPKPIPGASSKPPLVPSCGPFASQTQVDPAVTYHLNDEIRLRLSFSSDQARVDTAKRAPGGSAAAESDDLELQGLK